jgi:hypothetical protein
MRFILIKQYQEIVNGTPWKGQSQRTFSELDGFKKRVTGGGRKT